MNTDVVVGVSDRSSDALNLLFNDPIGRDYLTNRRKVDAHTLGALAHVGLSGNANIVAAIKLAKHFELDSSNAIVTIATDSAALYASEREAYARRRYPRGFDDVHAGELFGCHLEGIADDHVNEQTYVDRKRVFNLGYYTWVEQQGISVEEFDRRRNASFWKAIQNSIAAWDALISEFNRDTGAEHAG
jgi:cysteine synthase